MGQSGKVRNTTPATGGQCGYITTYSGVSLRFRLADAFYAQMAGLSEVKAIRDMHAADPGFTNGYDLPTERRSHG